LKTIKATADLVIGIFRSGKIYREAGCRAFVDIPWSIWWRVGQVVVSGPARAVGRRADRALSQAAGRTS
jgi:hypothetical protein